jgi:hypothetical protein
LKRHAKAHAPLEPVTQIADVTYQRQRTAAVAREAQASELGPVHLRSLDAAKPRSSAKGR